MNRTESLRIGLLTGGGDCPGLNAVIRAVTRTAIAQGNASVVGIEDGFDGLYDGRMRLLNDREVDGLLKEGGTILGTSNKGDPWQFPVAGSDGSVRIEDVSRRMLQRLQEARLDALVVVGGDGTMKIAHRLALLGVPIVGVPKTIDNDLQATDVSFGYDTAVGVVSDAIDKLRTTASSHHRVMLVEVMGRTAGWIALGGGLAGGADTILIPELGFRWESLLHHLQHRATQGQRYSIVCVAEGTPLPQGDVVLQSNETRPAETRLFGGIAAELARQIQLRSPLDARAVVLGHLQRGGSPSAADRLLATRFGVQAARAVLARRFGVMVALRGQAIVEVALEQVAQGARQVPADHDWINTARAVGVHLGGGLEPS
ncbi:MAG: 6-phosphofructokinase [Burkholderiales bacterium]